MHSLQQQSVLVVGGSRGLGLGVVEALVDRGARVTVLGRDGGRLKALQERLGVSVVEGDATTPGLAEALLRERKPSVLILNAGAVPAMEPLVDQSWEDFSRNWNSDVKATLFWVQAALRLPLARGSRVLISSSGAAISGSPLSGGYAGAKRMTWLLAEYGNDEVERLNLGIRFQAILPRQIIGATDLGRAAAAAYAEHNGVSVETFLSRFGKPLGLREYGEHVATILTDSSREADTAFAVKGDSGIQPLAS